MAGDLWTFHADAKKKRIAVAVQSPIDHGHYVAAGIALVPVFFAAAAPENHFSAFDGSAERLFVHPGHHEHVVLVGVLNDGGNQKLVAELNFVFDFF